MKYKFLFTALITAAIFSGTKAQSFQKSQMDINFGVGIGNTFIHSGAYRTFPAISTSFDYGVTDAISVGAYLGYAGATYRYSGTDWCPSGNGNGNAYGNYYNYTDTYKWKFSIVGLRGAYHFAKFIKNEKTDVYAGVMLGANFAKSTYTTDDPCFDHVPYAAQKYGGFVASGFLGARYRFTDMVGIFGELGYGISYLTLGVNFRF
ncbi:MAG: hypothetical protein H0W61_10940 [Bacteroidetes bacterium]|nr:hypothetical protein [Bacteroidota bacterium]